MRYVGILGSALAFALALIIGAPSAFAGEPLPAIPHPCYRLVSSPNKILRKLSDKSRHA